ncbi:MAG: hypothetical protein N2483_06720, partial [Burkholderiaceae bacterium]|nr:hypothetical protein [Burkholderiaceae bacterium]
EQLERRVEDETAALGPALLVIEAQDPAAAGLACVAVASGPRFFEVLTQQWSAAEGTVRHGGVSVDGNRALAQRIVNPGTSSSLALPTPADGITGPWTVFAEFCPEVGATSAPIFATTESSIGNGFSVFWDDAVSVYNGLRAGNNYNGAGGWSSTDSVLGADSELRTHRAAWAWDGANGRTYARGRLDNSTAVASGPVGNVNRRCRFLTSVAGVTGAASASLIMVWSRAISLQEYALIYRNPWQLFAPAPKRLWALPGGGTTHNVTLTESATAADAASSVLSAAPSLTEAAASVDAAAAQLLASVALSETASAADAASSQLVAFVVIAEAAAASDSATTGSVAAGALTEALSPTDAATTTASFSVSATETVAAADAASAIAARVAPLAEALSATDAITVTAVLMGAASEALAVADAYATGPVTSATLAESASLTDAVGVAIAAVAAAAESVVASEAVYVVLSTGAQQLEPAALADLVGSVRTTLATLGEPAVAADAASAADGAVHSAALAEDVSLADLVAALGLVVYVRDRTLVIAADPRTLVIAADPRTLDVRPS